MQSERILRMDEATAHGWAASTWRLAHGVLARGGNILCVNRISSFSLVSSCDGKLVNRRMGRNRILCICDIDSPITDCHRSRSSKNSARSRPANELDFVRNTLQIRDCFAPNSDLVQCSHSNDSIHARRQLAWRQISDRGAMECSPSPLSTFPSIETPRRGKGLFVIRSTSAFCLCHT